MRYVWVALALVGTLAVGLLLGLSLGAFGAGGERGSAPSHKTITVEKTVPAQTSGPKTTSSPASSTAPTPNPTGSVGSLDDARAAFEQAVKGYGNPNLKVGEVMEFSNNYYTEVKEKNTGIGAMELLINRPGSRVYQEPGPNMMWNTKYGMMSGAGGYGRRGYGRMMGPNGGMMGSNGGGMMGRSSASASASASAQNPRGNTSDKMAVDLEQARKIADAYLTRVSPGTKAQEPTKFYGYYTVDTEKDGKTVGMLSVNGF